MAEFRNFPFEQLGLGRMNEMQPKFGVSSQNISILEEPKQFFEEIKVLTNSSKRRITIASLYIGTEDLEQELVNCIHGALNRIGSVVQVQILLDAVRGSRGHPNCRTLLLPLLKAHPEQTKISLYHSPHLRGWLKWILPSRWNETIGIHHLKIYLFDDTLILSGANFDRQYFENRQDRYIVFRNCLCLSNFFAALVSTISQFSFQVNCNNQLDLHPQWKEHPYLGNLENFIDEAQNRLQALLSYPWKEKDNTKDKVDTWIFPLLQMKIFNICQDEEVTHRMLVNAPTGSSVKIASGYFNMPVKYVNALLKCCRASVDMLIASPKVNGFFGARGAAGAIPSVYVCIEQNFFRQVTHQGQQDRVSIHEFERDNWTFHAKGIWYYPPGAQLPVMTFIGSPNFGYRSVYRDLEAQVVLVTTNTELQQQLHLEQERLFKRSHVVSEESLEREDYKVTWWIRFLTKLLKTFL